MADRAMAPAPPVRLLPLRDAARYLGIGPTFFLELVRDKAIPKAKKIGVRRSVWDVRDLDAYVDDLPRDAFVGEQRTENGIDSAAVHTDFHIAERHDADRRFVRKCNSGLPGHRIDRFLDGCISQGQGDIVVLCIQLFSRRQRKDVAQQQQQHTASRPKNR